MTLPDPHPDRDRATVELRGERDIAQLRKELRRFRNAFIVLTIGFTVLVIVGLLG